MNMNKYIVKISTLVAMALMSVAMNAQQTLTLEQCREMAVENNKTLKQAETKIEMAGYDRKIAFANYLPNISATGAYIYNANDRNFRTWVLWFIRRPKVSPRTL